MAKIVFMMDLEEGHIIPSFGLALSLRNSGHQITYVSVVDNMDLILDYGFEFYPILEKVYYKGYKNKHKVTVRLNGSRDQITELQSDYVQHIEHMLDGGYDELLSGLKADIYIVSTFLHTDILVLHYKYHIRPVIFTPFLREPGRSPASDCVDYLNNVSPEEIFKLIDSFIDPFSDITSLSQVTEPMDSFCEIVVCPKELDTGDQPARPNVHYIGPCIRDETESFQAAIEDIPGNKQLIFASLGSQSLRYGKITGLFFEKLINIMRHPELNDYHLVLSLGNIEKDTYKFESVPPNVSVKYWVPQISVIKRSAIAIIHGGLGAIKECIYFGIPMIVFPMGYDQPRNALRIQQHGLGFAGNIEEIPESQLKDYILNIKEDSRIIENVERMRTIFVEKDKSNLGAEIIEDILANA